MLIHLAKELKIDFNYPSTIHLLVIIEEFTRKKAFGDPEQQWQYRRTSSG